MRKIYTILLITLSLTGTANVYYTAPDGNDANAGTISSPWFTLNKVWTVLAAGDTVYMRGGIYRYNEGQRLILVNGNAGNIIKLWAYPGELPIITKTPGYNVNVEHELIFFQGSYFHFKGLEISNFSQDAPGNVAWTAFRSEGSINCIYEQIDYHHNAGSFTIRAASTGNLFLNCDFHHNADPFGFLGDGQDPYGGSDGLGITITNPGTINTVRGCRAWWNSDDGFDLWENNGFVIIENCWSWYNGYIPGTFTAAGDGSGYKLANISQTAPLTLLRVIRNNVSFRNRLFGFNEAGVRSNAQIYNNTSTGEGAYGYWFDHGYGTEYSNYIYYIRNNISFNNPEDPINPYAVQENNSWQNGLLVTAADFVSLDSTQLENPRQANGDLPVITFLHLSPGSDMIDNGMNVGLPYFGIAPDLGAFETSGAAPPANQPPVANAGIDQVITLPTNNTTLDGSASSDPDGVIDTYAWVKISGPVFGTITNPSQAITTITGLAQGIYLLELTVTDNAGAIDKDTMQLTVDAAPANVPPVANASIDQTITLPTNNTTLDGSASSDSDGTITNYLWIKIAGPAAGSITSPASAVTVVTGLVQGVYLFELNVLDNNGATDTDTIQITVNPPPNVPPVSNAGTDQVITLPTSNTTLNGSASADADGTITTYLWTKIAGPLAGTVTSPASAVTSVTGLVQGVYLFELTVTDNNGAADTDTMQLTVNPVPNQLPVAYAGPDQTITLPTNVVTIDGSGSFDPDGTITTWAWAKIAGPVAGTITNPAAEFSTVTGLVQGVYLFELTITDNDGATDTDTMQVTVNAAPNVPPVSNAGIDQVITLPTNNTTLDGSASADADGTITTYLWTKVSGPLAGTVTSPASVTTPVTGLVQGVYLFELTVTDNNGATDTDTIQVTVNAAPNIPPVAAAGIDQTITLPTNNTTLDGSASADADGTITTYAWVKISGPVFGSITNPLQAVTTITGLAQGIYLLELTVTDNAGAIDKDTMQLTVDAAPANVPPIANAGTDQTITLPTNNTTIDGSASSDSDGTITNYLWIKIAGPAAGSITSPASAVTVVTGLVQGVYLFELNVLDNNGATDTDTIQVTVNAAPNVPPVSNAGTDQVITLPTNNTTLDGSASADADGTITTYAWIKISGPLAGTVTSPASAVTSVTGLVQGVYLFELTVTDNNGATDTDTIQVTVNAAPNVPPVAAAGTDQVITLPTNNTTLDGSASADADGTITTYAWIKISGPLAGTVTSPVSVTTPVTGLVQGVYLFELTVTDNNGATDTDTIQVTVNAAPNVPPVAAAGTDQVITLPTNNTTLDGSASTDADGTITTYLWTKIAGPVAGTVTSPVSAVTPVTGLVQGVYLFELTVTDNNGATDTDTIQVTVNAAPNVPPVAAAGTDQVITLPTNNTTLDGSASTDADGTITTYLWTKVSGPLAGTVTNPASVTTAVTGLVQGVYLFELTVTDNNGATDTDTIQVTVNAAPNVPPVAAAGTDQVITLPTNNTTLDGSASTDADGTITTYLWTKIAGPVAGTVTNPASVTTAVTGLVQGVYLFELTVTDNNGATDTDTIQVTVNAAPNVPPVSNAGTDQVITLPTNNTTLDGSASTDADGTITTYAWIKISGPLAGTVTNPVSAVTPVTGLVQGVYLFELTVTDNNGATDTDTIQVTVNAAPNVPPVAAAGTDQVITLPTNNTTLDGSASTDADGTITTYLWTKIAGPVAGTVTSPVSAVTPVTGLVQGVYLFELTVTDNNGATDTDTIQVTVNAAPNVPPVSNAGTDQVITLPTNNTTLDGSASTDADGTITTYAWIKISGPLAGTVTNPVSAVTPVTGLVQGVYLFELTVTDNNGATDTDTIQVTVNAAPNVPPVAAAGTDQVITLPTNNTTLDGSASADADGTITTYLWTKIAGPLAGTVTSPVSAVTPVTGLVQGVYLFELTVTDNNGATDTDTIQVTVNAAPNVPPVSNAGTDQVITLPTNNTTLDGSASTDADGTITTYAWIKISGPLAGTVTNPVSAVTPVTGLVQGVYLFELTVTDNNGATDTDTIQVTVNAAPNVPPVAAAGTDQVITLPTNNTTLDGSASTDADGTITTYLWTKIAGPVAGTVTSPVSAVTPVTGLVQGVYLFELTVTDNNGATDTDTIQVTVNAAPNVPPVSNAGIDQVITLPTNNTTLDGSASTDADGTITTYAWIKISGPLAGTVTSPASVTTAVTGLVQGVYLFELTVTDNNGATDTDTIQVTVNAAPNVPPVAAAGTDQVITLPTNNTTLDGSASTDADGTITTYLWTKIAGPVAGTVTSPVSAVTPVTGLVQGVYLFELTVTDNNGATDTDTIQVTVNAAPNVPPVAAAGTDQVITLPTNNTTLDGSASTDADGTITTYLWTKIAGPVAGTVTNPASVTTAVTGLVQGVYLFELTVTDNNGATDTDTIQVTVNAAPNVPPVSNAGIDQVITLPTSNTTLDGSASADADGTITTYAWIKISGPLAGTVTSPVSAVTPVTGLVQGVYLFELTVTDNNGATDTDTIQVTVNAAPNVPPVSNAGTDQVITLPTNNTTLDGSASTDADGTITTYAWIKISGPLAGTVTNPASVTTAVTGLVQGVYLFELTVTDNNGATDTDTIQVTVNAAPNVPPVAAAGTDQVITLPTNNTTLDGSASADADGTITTYAWIKISGPLAGTVTNPASVTTPVTGLVQGVYLFELTVTDNNGATDTDTIQVTVNAAPNVPPVAAAGIDQVITLPTNNTTLDGSASTDADGTITTYAWIKISGPVAGTVTSPASVTTAVTGLVQGVYLFELTVTDNNGATDTDTIQVTVNAAPNVPPVSNAGIDQVITLPTNNTTLDGSASTDADGTITTYLWTKIAGPVAGTVTNPASVTTAVTGLVQGVYLFELTVTDNNGATDTDTIQVTVNAAPNVPPVSNAGTDQVITLPTNNTTLDGSASTDADGTITTYAWIKISGPLAGTVTNPVSVTTPVTGLVQGVYLFELTVTDNNGATDTDTIQVTVNAAPNVPPVAAAGTDQVITLPTNNTTLDGSASTDADGTITTYLWTKVSGPLAGTVTSPVSAVTPVTGLVQGVYLFELTVTDNNGATDTDTIQVTVNAAPNVPPVAAAGTDQVITLPTNNTTLDGSASTDADGTITTYAWIKISGPLAGTVTNPASVTTAVTGLVQGVYLFELTVTDNNGATDTDTIQVTVNAAPNVPPVSNAGIDQVITLPTNNTTLDGSASTDADGTITTYAWIKISGPLAGTVTNPVSAVTPVTGLVQGVYLFELTVTDNNGATDTDTIQVTVNAAPNVPPVAAAGTDQVITLPTNNTTLDGSASTDADGTITTYLWTKIAGPVAGTVTNPASVTTAVTGLVQGVYLFELTVTDNNGATDTDTIQVTVNAAPNVPPVSNAGTDQVITLPTNNTTLDGSASTDADGTITTYAWIKISGPLAGTVTNPVSAVTPVTGLVQGVYLFELTVTDNNGATDTDTIQVTVNAAPNVPPVAAAGTDQVITLPTNNTTLDGSASTDADGTITTYAWIKISGPLAGTVTNPASVTTAVTGLVQGVYLFELTVTDNNGATDTDTIQVTVNAAPNVPPVAAAGTDQVITLPTNNTTLDGSASADADGTITTYAWIKISGPLAGTVTSPASVTTPVTGLVQGVYLFELTVTDNNGATDTDTIQVTVNAAPNVPPVAAAGIDQVITLPTNNTTLDGSASTDADGTITTYAWIKISGPVAGTVTSPASVTTAVTGLVQGVYLFELTVTDNNGATDTDTIQVTVNAAPNVPPVSNAGIDQVITLPTNNTTLDGSASTDADGTITTYLWTKIAGPVAGTVTNPASVTTAVTGLVQGVYLFELTVTDNNGATDTDTIQVTVNAAPNVPPVSNAGTDQVITLPTNNTTLDGSASTDADGTITTYAWIKISGPLAGTVTNPVSVTTPVTGLVQGVYLFELTVTDNNGATDTDTIQVTVNAAPNVPPVAAAGTDQVITLPTNNTTLDGSASTDADGTITTYLWTKVSGPLAGTVTSPVSAVTPVTGLVQGVYLFELTVTDNNGATDTDTIQVTVNAAPNVPPVAAAGTDQVITLPTNNTTLDGSASTDADGTITTYAWIKISGPLAGTVTNPASVTTAVTGLVQGVYLFELTVTDNNGATDTDTIQVTVNAAPNVPPVSNAGIDQVITLPTNNTTLDGSASTDADGTITTYAWIKISGPLAGTVTNPVSAVTPVTGLVQGVYLFELTVTDNNGATDTDTIQVTVNAAPNVPPVAAAGTDQVITLPTNNTTLDGSASTDADGTITTYLWTKIAGPVAGTVTNPASVTTAVTGLVQGVYLFELTVTDNNGATDTDTIQVTVNAAPNVPPVSNAGTDQVITLPTNNTTLDGSASTDADGTITTYAWIKISGPLAGTVTNPVSAVTPVTGLVQGVYLFELTVTDNNGATDTDTIQVTVNAAPNVPPVAAAGTDQVITLPTNNTTLDGSASTDADGTITTYLWTKIAGPVAGTVTSPVSAVTPVTGLVQGVYLFELTVTDNNGATDTDTIQVTVNAAPNVPPVAAAGTDQVITLPTNNTTLDGSASTDADGTITTYLWTKIAGPLAGAITTPGLAVTSVTGLVPGVYLFELTVTDNNGATDTDTMRLTVNATPNVPPTANAGVDQTITLPTNNTTLDGSASTDADGTITTYLWTKVGGPVAGTISNPSQSITTVTGLVQGVYLFELTVTDNNGATDKDTMQVTVNAAPNIPPVAAAGVDQTITLPTSNVTINGLPSSDPDGTISTYLWAKIAGPVAGTISNPSQSITTVTGLVQGVYLFELTVTDNNGAADKDTMQVTVNAAPNIPPVAAAGIDQTITLPTSNATLDGSASADADGTITTYLWTKIAGPVAGTITSPSLVTTPVTGLVQGVYLFELTVTDNNGATDTDTIQVTVNAAPNVPPVSNAGTDQVITLPTNNTTLDGSASTDADGTITTYAWIKISGPLAGTVTSPASAVTAVTGLVQGVYLFELTVTDNNGAADKDTIQVTVNAALNIPPVSNAGIDQTITLPTNNTILNGSASTDADGTITTYAWVKIAGPAAGTITTPGQALTSVTGLVQGAYLFELTVTDNNGATDKDTVQVSVNPVAPNLPPIANAGSEQTTVLPTNNITLDGSASSDPDGIIVSYQWTRVDGPAQYTIITSSPVKPEIRNLVLGIYRFELMVTDNRGLTDRDTVTIHVTDGIVRVQAYPNPVETSIFISITSGDYNNLTRISIYNAAGSVIHKEQLRRNQFVTIREIDMSKFANGIYFLEITADSKTKRVIKFIKQ